MTPDPDIISLIIQEERAKKLERDAEYGCPQVLYIEPPDYRRDEEETEDEESLRGVVVIDI